MSAGSAPPAPPPPPAAELTKPGVAGVRKVAGEKGCAASSCSERAASIHSVSSVARPEIRWSLVRAAFEEASEVHKGRIRGPHRSGELSKKVSK